MGVIVRTCCCGCDLRTGAILIALFYLAAQAYSIYGNIAAINILKDNEHAVKSSDSLPASVQNHYDGIINFSYAAAVINGIDLLISVVLLVGVLTRSRLACLAWIVWRVLYMLISLAYFIFLISIWTAFAASAWIVIVGFVLAFYFILIVYSYAELLKEEDEQGGNPAYGQAQAQPAGIQYVAPVYASDTKPPIGSYEPPAQGNHPYGKPPAYI